MCECVNKNSAIAEITQQSCTIQIFFQDIVYYWSSLCPRWGQMPLFNALIRDYKIWPE